MADRKTRDSRALALALGHVQLLQATLCGSVWVQDTECSPDICDIAASAAL